MAGQSSQEISKHTKIYVLVFLALGILTAVTVGVSYLNFGYAGGIIVALIIACVKGSLVALYFMHLNSEKRSTYSILALTAFLFFALIFLFVSATVDDYGHSIAPDVKTQKVEHH